MSNHLKNIAIIILLLAFSSLCMAWELSGTTLANTKARAAKAIASAQDSIGFNCEARPAVNEEEGKQKEIEAVSWFQKAADQGYAFAQYHLGLCYDDGIGVQSNYTTAFDLFQKAADQQFAPAEWKLGTYYFLGKGSIQMDKKKMHEYYMKSAEHGFEPAQSSLGYTYADYDGVNEFSAEQSIYWYKKAVANPNPASIFEVGTWGPTGKAGEAQALGEYYYNGAKDTEDKEILAVNYDEAFKCLKISADANNSGAYLLLGTCYAKGQGTTVNNAQSYFYLSQALNNIYDDDEKKADCEKMIKDCKAKMTKSEIKDMDAKLDAIKKAEEELYK